MKVERFQAQNMAQAVAMIKERLGPDAVILHSRQLQKGLFRRPVLEVIAAVDEERVSPIPPPLSPPPALPTQPRLSPEPPPVQKGLDEVQVELASLRQSIAHLTWEMRTARLPVLALSLQRIHEQLLTQGMVTDLATEVVLAASDELSASAAADMETATNCVARHLQARIATREIASDEQAGAVVFLVGPAGVGKTVTLAKLAGYHARGRQRRIRLISADTYRVGALAQLQSYGNIMGIVTEAVYTVDELAVRVSSLQQADLILVDTPGVSPRDRSRLDELAAMVAAVGRKEVYLALACATAYPDMEEITRFFRAIPLDGLMMTKSDETNRLGAAISLAQHSGLPLACLTMGQRIPEDIEMASAQRLADRVARGMPDEARGLDRSNGLLLDVLWDRGFEHLPRVDRDAKTGPASN
jgi:flagellar biosynthesis protein FlhF